MTTITNYKLDMLESGIEERYGVNPNEAWDYYLLGLKRKVLNGNYDLEQYLEEYENFIKSSKEVY